MEKNTEKTTDLSLVDLKNLSIILDYAANNGLFKGWDTMKNVISLKERLDNFIKANEKISDKNSVENEKQKGEENKEENNNSKLEKAKKSLKKGKNE